MNGSDMLLSEPMTTLQEILPLTFMSLTCLLHKAYIIREAHTIYFKSLKVLFSSFQIVYTLVIFAATRVGGEAASKYRNSASSFGEILKPPPPPPPLHNILPVPFHGGSSRTQRQNIDIGYQYPPPPPPPPQPPSSNFKFPAPFYRQYSFNFVPPPQPFTSTPSPTMFHKVSNWLFPPASSSYSGGSQGLINSSPIKKDCNPCNLVPWIPVIRYDLAGKNLKQNLLPTYGPPSPTAVSDNNIHSMYQYPSQSFHPLNNFNNNFNSPVKGGIPHAVYGPPASYSATSSSTYGPPSPTHTISVSSYQPPTSTYGIPSSSYNAPVSSYGLPSSSYGTPSSTYGPPSSTYGTPTRYQEPSVTPSYDAPVPNYEPPQHSSVKVIQNAQLDNGLTLPKVSAPTGFRNSYGEPITNNYALNIPYPVSATAAESLKVKTKILPYDQTKPESNETFSVNKPSPFSVNKGRNIHTLQPVALPNLSVSPLPPIFNARPFRPNTKIYLNNLQGINGLQQNSDNIDITKSVPVAEFTHSVDYPPTVIQSPVIDVNFYNNFNQSKAYRNIPNSYSDEFSHDISSQASEDHLAATKTNHDIQESSFESTGLEFDNDFYDNKMPMDFRKNSGNSKIKSNDISHFTDLRGASDEDVDKFRTDANLQSIDSPLLYLKPSAPHKDFDNFVTPSPTSPHNNDYEIYDDFSTTSAPELTSILSFWNKENLSDYKGILSPPPVPKDKSKVVQIIIPYTTNNNDINDDSSSQDWISASADESQGRKVPPQNTGYTNTESAYVTESTFTEQPDETETTQEPDENKYNTHSILNDLYDVKEPPFDIIKLQQNIDDWTEQEYAKNYKNVQKVRLSGKYSHAKRIPDDYFTTPSSTSYETTPSSYNYHYNFYDYEGSSSIQHPIRDYSTNKTRSRNLNHIEKNKNKSGESTKSILEDLLKPHIYTASSSFRLATTTTPAPWGKIETSISPLTKEKVYVVTSKPWRDSLNVTTWYSGMPFESKKTALDNDVSASDNMPFKSPRFLNRPAIVSSGSGGAETLQADSSFRFSKTWHQSSEYIFIITTNIIIMKA